MAVNSFLNLELGLQIDWLLTTKYAHIVWGKFRCNCFYVCTYQYVRNIFTGIFCVGLFLFRNMKFVKYHNLVKSHLTSVA